jgi:hypothetical protein
MHDFLERPIDELFNGIKAHAANEEGAKLNELRYFDVTCNKERCPISQEFGLYWFSQNKEIIYVGKAGSMSFVDRIAEHIQIGTHHFKNQFIKRLAGIADRDKSTRNVPEAAVQKAGRCRIGLFHMGSNEEVDQYKKLVRQIAGLERILIKEFQAEPALPQGAWLNKPMKNSPAYDPRSLLQITLTQIGSDAERRIIAATEKKGPRGAPRRAATNGQAPRVS